MADAVASEIREAVSTRPLKQVSPPTKEKEMPPSVFDKIMEGYRALGWQREYPINQLLADLITTPDSPRPKFSSKLTEIFSAGKVTEAEARYAHHTVRGFAEQLQDLMTQLSGEPKTHGAKVIWASLNQRISVGLYHCLQENYDEAQDADSFLELLKAFTAPGIRGRQQFAEFLTGVRAQAGLMQFFSEGGYQAIPLNWKDKAEIEEFDLKGVDFLAVDPLGTTFLVDAKAKFLRGEGVTARQNVATAVIPSDVRGETLRTMKPFIEAKLEKAFQQKLLPDKKSLVMKRYRGVVITLPSVGDFLGEYGMITDERIRKEVLEKLKLFV